MTVETQRELYWFGTPYVAVVVLLLIALAFGLAVGYLALNYERLAGEDSPIFFKYFFFALSAVFVMTGLRPKNWQRWTYFMLTPEGVRIPERSPVGRDTPWVCVPWERVNAITVEKPYGSPRSVCLWLNLSEEEAQGHFRNLQLTHRLLGFEHEQENTPVAFSNAFARPERAVAEMNAIRSLYR